MTDRDDNVYARLTRVFHEPNRLAIVSALAGVTDGLTFSTLKRECDLTDGNLSRHLKTLEEAGMVVLDKRFVGAKPQTTVILTDQGRDQFVDYLDSLATALLRASEALDTSTAPGDGHELDAAAPA